MDIDELEFIRDFIDHFDQVKDDMDNICLSIDECCENDEIKEVPLITTQFLWSVSHQLNLLEKLFMSFKNRVDEKYWQEWFKKYPQMHLEQHQKDTL